VITDQHEVETQFNVALESQVLFSAFEWARNKDEWTENYLKNYFIADQNLHSMKDHFLLKRQCHNMNNLF